MLQILVFLIIGCLIVLGGAGFVLLLGWIVSVFASGNVLLGLLMAGLTLGLLMFICNCIG